MLREAAERLIKTSAFCLPPQRGARSSLWEDVLSLESTQGLLDITSCITALGSRGGEIGDHSPRHTVKTPLTM